MATAIRDLLETHGRLAGALLLFTAFLFPLAPNLVPVAAVTAFLVIAVRHHGRSVDLRWKALATPWPYLILLYVWHVIAMAWSANKDFGYFDLQIKAPLLLLPLLALWMRNSGWQGRSILLFVFSIGNSLAVLVCIGAAAWRIAEGGGLSAAQEVFSSRWSLFMHPSYFAMYLTVGMVGWCLLPIGRGLPSWADRGVLAVLCIGVVLCGSKVGWLLLLLLLPLLLALRWRDQHVRRSLLEVMAVFIIGVIALVSSSRYAMDRVHEVFRAATEQEHKADAETSSEVRWLTWGTAWQLFKEDPIAGTGTGDIKDELVKAYEEHGYTAAAAHRLNAHNQFIQTAACLGLPGLLLICAMLLVPLFATGFRDPFVVIFLLISLVNWMVESTLEVQAGALFFAFFACIMYWTGEGQRSSPGSFSNGPSSRTPII